MEQELAGINDRQQADSKALQIVDSGENSLLLLIPLSLDFQVLKLEPSLVPDEEDEDLVLKRPRHHKAYDNDEFRLRDDLNHELTKSIIVQTLKERVPVSAVVNLNLRQVV